MALDNVRSHKLRSFLTVLGVVIGVLVVVVIASILTGMRLNIVRQIEEYGTNNIFAFHLSTGPRFGPRDRAEVPQEAAQARRRLAIKEQARLVEDVATWRDVDPGRQLGALPGRQVPRPADPGRERELHLDRHAVAPGGALLHRGRRPGSPQRPGDRDQRGRGAVPHKSSALGTEVTLAGQPFRVVGVLEKRKAGGLVGEDDDNNQVFLPYRTARKISPRTTDG
jgi:putative ABC transport system permease protein